MISVKTTTMTGLLANAALTALVSTRIYFQMAPTTSPWPGSYITFYENTNVPAMFADDAEQLSEITYQFDVWSKGSTTAIAAALDAALVALGWVREFAGDLAEREDTTNEVIYHKTMRYVILV